MKFKLPEIHEITVEVDGERFEGSWYIILGDLVINYNGHTASTHQRKTNADAVAKKMLGDLVEKHYVRLETIPAGIPQTIRQAAHHYANGSLEESAAAELVASFGRSIVGSLTHRQLSWLCINGISMIVPAWKHMCDGNAAEEVFADLRQWLQDPLYAVDWATATTPAIALRDGIRVGDCDACRLEPTAEAVAHTARYLLSANAADATAALLSASDAFDEGCHTPDAPDRFEKWLVLNVLKSALDCQAIEKGP